MAFRDDKDALEQRLADLERDLKAAREDLDRKGDELRRLRERMGVLQKPAARKLPGAVLVVVALASLVGGGLAMWASTAQPQMPLGPPAPPEQHEEPVAPQPPPKPEEPERAPPTPLPQRSIADLVWKATIRSTSGMFKSPPTGSPCTIEAKVTGGDRVRVDDDHVVVRCGSVTLYDTAKPGGGHISGSVREVPVAGGAWAYQLDYYDVGPRARDERPQLEVFTEHGVARVSYDGLLAGTVDLTVDRNSQPRKGEKLVVPVAD